MFAFNVEDKVPSLIRLPLSSLSQRHGWDLVAVRRCYGSHSSCWSVPNIFICVKISDLFQWQWNLSLLLWQSFPISPCINFIQGVYNQLSLTNLNSLYTSCPHFELSISITLTIHCPLHVLSKVNVYTTVVPSTLDKVNVLRMLTTQVTQL